MPVDEAVRPYRIVVSDRDLSDLAERLARFRAAPQRAGLEIIEHNIATPTHAEFLAGGHADHMLIRRRRCLLGRGIGQWRYCVRAWVWWNLRKRPDPQRSEVWTIR